MKYLRTTRLGIAVVAAIALAACSDATQQQQLAPSTPSFSAGKVGKKSDGVDRGAALTQDITRSVTVTSKDGGKLEIKEAGLKIEVPKNALPYGQSSMTITVTALAGSDYAYEFQPAGTQFRLPLQIEQDVSDLTLRSLVAHLPQLPTVSYFQSRQDIDPVSGTVLTLEDLLTDFDLRGHTVKANIWHFSGYVVAWGRQ